MLVSEPQLFVPELQVEERVILVLEPQPFVPELQAEERVIFES
jgi:hypothetical protein